MPWGFAAAGIASAVIGSALAPDAPDMSGSNAAAQANSVVAGRAQDLAEKQYADQKALVDQYTPMFKEQIQKQLAAQDQSMSQSNAQWGQYQQYFAPIEQKLSQQAQEFNTEGRREQAAQQAGAQVAGSFDTARADQNRALETAGVMPGSGKALALDNASRIEEAKASAGAQNNARQQVEMQGISLMDNAARFGRNMPSTGLQTAALAGQQGQQAQGTYGQLSLATAAPGQYANPLFQTALSGNSSAGQLYQTNQGYQFAADKAYSDAVMGGAAAGAKMYGMYSSKTLKDMGEKVDGKAALALVDASPAFGWSYKPGEGDGSTQDRMGPTAESLAGTPVSDGTQIDIPSFLGLHHAAIGEQSKRLKRIERRLALSNAKGD